jgi:uncharacterized protein YgbK (DUF1537 family)
LEAATAAGQHLVVCDCIADRDLLALGAAAKEMALVTGGSGIAVGLAANFRERGELAEGTLPLDAPHGPILALAGSCSAATRVQITAHAHSHPTMQIDVEAVMMGDAEPEAALAWSDAQSDCGIPLIYSSAEPAAVRRAQESYGAGAVAAAMENFFGALAQAAVAQGYRRLIVAGGETASAVVSALGIVAMRIGPEIDPGVPMLVSEGDPALALALKSGNFGASDFFAKCRAVFEGAAGEH